MCTGDEADSLTKPTPMSLPDTATVSERISAQRNHADALRAYEAACRRNDQAIGMIKTHIEPSQFEGIDKLPTAKEVWEKLVLRHKDTHTGLSAFYTKVGILEKKYTDGEDMHTHLDFLTMENRKLDKKAFDDEFLAQIMLMSLPRDSTWETVVVVLLQSASDTTPLSTTIVSTKLMQEYRRITGGEHADSALAARQAKSSSSSSKAKKRCNYCKFTGQIEVECCKKKRDLKNGTTEGKDSGKDC